MHVLTLINSPASGRHCWHYQVPVETAGGGKCSTTNDNWNQLKISINLFLFSLYFHLITQNELFLATIYRKRIDFWHMVERVMGQGFLFFCHFFPYHFCFKKKLKPKVKSPFANCKTPSVRSMQYYSRSMEYHDLFNTTTAFYNGY